MEKDYLARFPSPFSSPGVGTHIPLTADRQGEDEKYLHICPFTPYTQASFQGVNTMVVYTFFSKIAVLTVRFQFQGKSLYSFGLYEVVRTHTTLTMSLISLLSLC